MLENLYVKEYVKEFILGRKKYYKSILKILQ